MANSAITPKYPLRLGWLLVIMLFILTACATVGDVGGSASTSLGDQPTDDGTEKLVDQVQARGMETDDAQNVEAAQETGEDLFFDFEALLAEALGSEPIARPSEAVGSDLILGGTPDLVSAAAITQGLLDAGVDLTGIEVAVLPITGMDASLIVFEVSDEAITLGEEGSDDDDPMMKALLAMPQIEEASITEVVTVYRGADDQGSFVFTFTVSIGALEQALASGSEIGDDMLVQIERSS